MNNLSSRIWVSSLGAALAVSVLPGCTTNVYNSPQPPPPEPQVVYVPTAPPDNPPPPPEPTEPPPPVYVPPPAPVTVIEIRADSDFYEPLRHYGRWVDVNGYGRCWVPEDVDHDWRPYTQGRWQRTDDGWYWSSEEPWGWATCHYGRWFLDPTLGWVWVPETQWAPAWVAWRDGDEYTGWAPLPPRARFRPEGDLERPDEDVDPHSFVFVEHRHMLEPQRPQTVIVNNITVVQKTVNITKITVVNKTVINEGPRPETIARAAGHTVNVVSAPTLRTQHEATAIARDHLQTKVIQAPAPVAVVHNPPPLEARGNEVHNPRPAGSVPPQHPDLPEHRSRPPEPRQPEPVQPVVLPNQPRLPQPRPEPEPRPRPPQPQVQAHPQPTPHQPAENNKPVNPQHVNQPPHPAQSIILPEPRPENHPPQNHVTPNEPRPEPQQPARPSAQHENDGNKHGQPEHPPQAKPEQNQQKKGAEKPHQENEKNQHSSTNAPPERR